MSLFSKLAEIALVTINSKRHSELLTEVVREVAIHASGVPITQDKHGELVEAGVISNPVDALQKRVAKLEKAVKSLSKKSR